MSEAEMNAAAEEFAAAKKAAAEAKAKLVARLAEIKVEKKTAMANLRAEQLSIRKLLGRVSDKPKAPKAPKAPKLAKVKG
jgi:hypothetical protein